MYYNRVIRSVAVHLFYENQPGADRVFFLIKEKKQSFLYGSTILMASMLLVKLIGALFKIPLTNIIGVTGMGYFNSAYNVYTTVYALTVTGLSTAVARMVAENAARGKYRDVRKIFRLSTIIFLMLGILGFLLILVSARGFSSLIDSPNSFWAVLMIAPSIFFCCLMAAYRGYYEGLSNMTPTAVTQVVEVVVKLASGLIFTYLVMGAAMRQYENTGLVFGTPVGSSEAAVTAALPFGAAAAMLGVSVSTLAGFLYVFLRHKLRGDSISKEMLQKSPASERAKPLLSRLIRIAVPITLGAVVLQLSVLIDTVTIQNRLLHCYQTAPELMTGLFGGYLRQDESIHEMLYGCFTTCAVFFNLVPAFTSIFGKSALPNVTSAWTRQDRRRLKLNIQSVLRITTLVSSPMAFGIAFLSGPILNALYGANEPRAALIGAPMLTILAVSSLFLALVSPMNAIMQGIGRMDLPVKYLCFGAVVKLILNVILVGIPSVNIMGSAISTLVCYLLIAFLSINRLRNILTVPLDFSSTLVKPITAGIICGFSAFLCHYALTKLMDNSIITLISIAFGGICYLISIGFLNAISKEDVLMLPHGNKIAKTLEKVRFIR